MHQAKVRDGEAEVVSWVSRFHIFGCDRDLGNIYILAAAEAEAVDAEAALK